jgi:hypothetical protein
MALLAARASAVSAAWAAAPGRSTASHSPPARPRPRRAKPRRAPAGRSPPPPSGPILWRSSLKNTIYDVLKARDGWQETESDTEWDFFWADKGCA